VREGGGGGVEAMACEIELLMYEVRDKLGGGGVGRAARRR
jgi:hypothetical protein